MSRRFHSAEEARRLARRRVPRMMFDFVDGAAGSESAARLNRQAIQRIRLQPRVLVDVDERTLAKRFLGIDMGLPFGIAPMGMCDLTWPGADRMLATEALQRRIPHAVSSAASTTLEELHALARAHAWFQLYVGQSLEFAMQLVDRAATTGYKVLILTVDVPQPAARRRDLRNGFEVPFRLGPRQFLDFACHPRWSVETLLYGVPQPQNYRQPDGDHCFVRNAGRGRIDWVFLRELRLRWKETLIVKGVLSSEDAVSIRQAGADAIWVSNHGGRQLDSAPAAIHALPLIREAVGADYPLLFDSGLRDGEGIVKALALGADFVMLGRAFLYAIGADGARGLAALIDILAEEISTTLAQLGRRRVADLDATVIAEPPPARLEHGEDGLPARPARWSDENR